MSSMIKKKGALAKTFKPKAPQARRPPGVPASASSSARPSVEPQSLSQTPGASTTIDTPQTVSPQPIVCDLTKDTPSQTIEGTHSTSRHEPNIQPFNEPSISNTSDIAATPSDNLLKRKPDTTGQTPPDVISEPQSKKARTVPPNSNSVEQLEPAFHQLTPDLQILHHTSAVQPTEDRSQPFPSVESFRAPTTGTLTRNQTQDDATQQNTALETTGPSSTSQQLDTLASNTVGEASPSRSPTRESTQDSQSDVDLSAMGPGEASRGSHIVPSAALNPDGTSGVTLGELSDTATSTKRLTKRKKIQPQDDDIRATIEIQLHRPKRAAGEKRPRKKKEGERKKRRRAPTPEGAEDEPLPAGTTMGDLCKDLRIGKKFSKHDEIRKKDNQKKIRAKLAKANPELAPSEHAEETGDQNSAIDDAISRPPNATIQMKIVDGNIVLEENSLRYDAHKEANRSGQVQEVVEENEFTKLLTSGTYMKRERAQLWTPSDNELFYKCLRSYGTDFQMISTHFPNRNRRQIKLKFNAEERINAARITRTLIGTPEPIDLEEHQSRAGVKYEEVADIEAQAQEKEQEHLAAQEAELEKQAESTRRKKEEIQARSGGKGGPGDSSKENEDGEASAAPRSRKKGGAAKNKPKNKHSIRGGGEEVEVLGSVDR